MLTTGRRIADDDDSDDAVFEPGAYGRIRGVWYACTPNGHAANLSAHAVIEHDDGTISVTPSILVTKASMPDRWHGYLERGVWREC